MYLAHYGLSQPAFTLTPDTRFYLAQASHREAMNMLLVALRTGEGFLKLTGEIGLGKTLLCRQLLKVLKTLGPGFECAYIPNPAVTRLGLFRQVATELALQHTELDTADQLLQKINEKLVATAHERRRTVLIVDEAQVMPDESLEGLRLLTNLETETFKLLQVVLFGQPELEERLRRPELRQLRQRITFSHRLMPLDQAAFQAYVQHRLKVAGADEGDLFDRDSLKLLYRASGGVPRLVNILCHKALLSAYGPGRHRVTREDALAAIGDTDGVRVLTLSLPPWMRATGLTALAAALGIGAAMLLSTVA